MKLLTKVFLNLIFKLYYNGFFGEKNILGIKDNIYLQMIINQILIDKLSRSSVEVLVSHMRHKVLLYDSCSFSLTKNN